MKSIFFSELKKECKVTLKQIEEKEYVFVLKNAGIEDILKIGVVHFWGNWGKMWKLKEEGLVNK